ncbi:hypothetical protein ACHAWO_007020 [Cyclotella atomus]|uniref:Uncharacterized protein n=1 Tax=Cyclotella atomus TaxID=382360 RepID=A0ABD3ML70_9STRA
MGKIKLPKSLMRMLFPKSKMKKSTSADFYPISELSGGNAKSVVADGHSVEKGAINSIIINSPGSSTNDGAQLQPASSSSPTVAMSYSNESAVNIASMQFSFDDYDDASYTSDKVKASIDVAEDAAVEKESGDGKGCDDQKPAEDSNENDEKAVGTDSMPTTAEFEPVKSEDKITQSDNINNVTDILNEPDDNPPSFPPFELEPLPNHSSPAAQLARQKALARQKRILSKCEERLNALAGTAEATLEGANKVRIDRAKQMREKQHKAKLNLDRVEKQKEDKQFSTIVFYESNQAEGEINLFDNEQPLSPLSVASEAKDSPNNVIDQQGFPVGHVDAPLSCETPIPFFILLLDPKSRIFELIEIDDAEKSCTVKQVLDLIPSKCTDERLLNMNYIGLCRPSDRAEFTDLSAAAFKATTESCLASNECIMEDDVLVAILQDSNGFQMCKISKPILKNGKFRDMIRRRRKGKKSRTDKSVEIVDETKVPAVMKTATVEDRKEKYNTLCKKLETLSKKLHQVDEQILAGDVGLQEKPAVAQAPELTVNTLAEAPSQEVTYRMSPKMVATELAQHIEDIFADHDVEILAVDADDDDESDDGTFVSARSHKSVRSVRSLMAKQIELTNKQKGGRRQRAKNTNLFEGNDDNALALQIEAMAVQAEEAFGSRHGRKSAEIYTDVHADVYEVPEMPDMTEANEGMAVIPEEFESSDILDTMKSLTRGSAVVDMTNCTPSQKEAFSRNFLNTSTSMVSTMVAATHGRVNEVHVLQYLGCTIVCIAANFAQQRQDKQTTPISPNSGARLFQSAMFLAFMVNGQRYLAKVTKK